jgi:hypothetical protein
MHCSEERKSTEISIWTFTIRYSPEENRKIIKIGSNSFEKDIKLTLWVKSIRRERELRKFSLICYDLLYRL